MILRNCGKCALKAHNGGICPIFQKEMDDEQGCPYFKLELDTCDICGQIIVNGGIFQDETHLVCNNCGTGSSCSICVHAHECRFQTDRSCTEPPHIPVQQRQGNMVIQTQIPNPKRIELTCAAGCPCYYPEGATEGAHCWKQFNCACKNYKTNYIK